MLKRGQVTIFIILGIVIVAAVGLFLYLGDFFEGAEIDKEDSEAFVASQIEPTKKVVRDCVKESLIDSILFVSIQGGYFDPVHYELVGGYNISYSCKDGVNELPLLDFISGEILEYMAQDSEIEKITDCIGTGFDVIEGTGIDLDYSFNDLSLFEPQITNEKAIQQINFPLSLSSYDSVANVNELVIEVKTSLRSVYVIAVDIVNEECGNGNFIIEDYVWEDSQALDVPVASITNGPIGTRTYQPWYLTSYEAEESGEFLKFHFLIEE